MTQKQLPSIRLRPTTAADLDRVVSWEADPDTGPFIYPWPRARHEAALGDRQLDHLMIEVEGVPAGFVILARSEVSGNVEFRRIVVGEKHGGVGRAAIRAVKRRAFEELGAHRLWLDVKPHNVRARHLYRSEGFREEGELRECVREGGSWDSLVLMAMLEPEFRAGSPGARGPSPAVLEGIHVRLEPLSEGHVPGLARVGLDPDIWSWMPEPVTTLDEMRAWVRSARVAAGEGSALPFATVERGTGTVVGSTRFGNIALEHRRVEIGWTWITPGWQRTAVNTEAKLLMLRHAFDEWGCERVELKTDALNVRSRRAIARIGAKEEGVLRRHMIVHGGRARDTVYFGITREEWPEVARRLEERLRRGSA